MLSNYTLIGQLYSFMQAIPELWSWEALEKLCEAHESHKEYRGPEDQPLIFTLQVLEKEVKHSRTYLHIFVDASDVQREIGLPGSSNTPLGTTFLWYQDGELDMPTAKDIYEGLKE